MYVSLHELGGLMWCVFSFRHKHRQTPQQCHQWLSPLMTPHVTLIHYKTTLVSSVSFMS